MAEPSVKGSMLSYSVEAMHRLMQGDGLAGVEIEKRLSPETLEVLNEKVIITNWYPMWKFNEIQEFLWEFVCERNPVEARSVGADWFKTMMKSGRYQQFEYAGRASGASSKKDMLRQTRLIASVLSLYYNFLDIEVSLDSDSQALQVHFRNASLFCEPLRYMTEGYLTAISRVRGATNDWISERLAPDVIVFTLPHAKRKD